MIAYSIMNWKDPDQSRHHVEYGAEKNYYEGLDRSYKVKNAPFDSIEELLLVRDVDEDVYQILKNHITIFPKQGSLKINLDTASEKVLLSIARAFSGKPTNTTMDDAKSLVTKMLAYRKGNDGLEATADDAQIDNSQMSLNSKENVLFAAMNSVRTKNSNYFKIQSIGKDLERGIQTKIETTMHSNDLKIVYWKRYE